MRRPRVEMGAECVVVRVGVVGEHAGDRCRERVVLWSVGESSEATGALSTVIVTVAVLDVPMSFVSV